MMSPVSGIGGLGGPMPGGGGALSPEALSGMKGDQLLNVLQNGSQQDKLAAFAELLDRLGLGNQGNQGGSGAGGAGGPSGGGGCNGAGGAGGAGNDLMEILQKILSGQKPTAEEMGKLQNALQGADSGSGVPQ